MFPSPTEVSGFEIGERNDNMSSAPENCYDYSQPRIQNESRCVPRRTQITTELVLKRPEGMI